MRVFRWLMVVIFCVGVARGEKVTSMPKPTGYVDDYAGVVTSEQRTEMDAVCTELHDKTKAQVFAVTVNTLEDASVEQFANDLFHQWKIGEKKTDRGVLLLLAIKEHRYRVEVGYGLEGILNDAKVGDIGREMVPKLKAGDDGNALEAGLRPIAKAIADDAGVTLDSLGPPEAASDAPVSSMPAPDVPSPPRFPWWAKIAAFVFALLFGAALIAVIVAAVKAARKGAKSPRKDSADDDFGPSTSGFAAGSGSSDFSSSDSSSSSSSSDSFSGGDGGDSGGGGASGSW